MTMEQLELSPRREHLMRLNAIWRSAGWRCHDAVELDLVAAGWAALAVDDQGRERLRLTEAGIQLLAQQRRRNLRSTSDHDRLAQRVAEELMGAGRIVWRELSLRAHVEGEEAGWRMARPDVFSVRHTSVQDYLQPMVHEVKVSRADLLSDLRHAAKRESYRWLSCETCYVFPEGVAEPDELPAEFGVWLLCGPVEGGRLERVRPAKNVPCTLPFAVWMALARATPLRMEGEAAQRELGDDDAPGLG